MSGDLERRCYALRRRVRGGGEDVRVVVSPYRVCPLGAHIDHQGGPVLGAAIDAHTLLAFAPSRDAVTRLASDDFEGEAHFPLPVRAAPPGSASRRWTVYAEGAAWALSDRLPERPRGIEGIVAGSLPGGGLSSSASVLLALLTAFAAANGIELAPEDLVRLSRRAENEYVGLASGLLDPAAIVGSQRGRLLAIETAKLSWEAIPFGGEAGGEAPRMLVAFSGVSRTLTGTGFNDRVAECVAAAKALGERAGAGPAPRLGDLDDAVFDAHAGALDAPLRRRARHFFTERARVRRGAELWRAGDLEGFGRLMDASCESSITSYEVGSPELVRLAEILREAPGVRGARFSGGGYGGCCVGVVEASRAEEARRSAERAFAAEFPALAGAARFFVAESEDGVRIT